MIRCRFYNGPNDNADERYGDSILPMLGLTHDHLQCQCFSKDIGFEKPDERSFMAALKKAEEEMAHDQHVSSIGERSRGDSTVCTDDPLLPEHFLHIGNDFTKDFEGAKLAGMHSVLLNRYGEAKKAEEWRRRGAFVFNDLMDVVEFLGRSGCRLG